MCVCITLCASVCSHRVFWLEVGVWAPGTLCFLHPFSACIFVCLLVHDLDEHLNKHKHTLQNNDTTIKQPTYTIKYTHTNNTTHTKKTHYTQSAQYTQTMTLTHTCRCRSIHTQTTHTHTQKHSKTTHSHTNNSKQLTLTHNDTQKQHVTHKQWHTLTHTRQCRPIHTQTRQQKQHITQSSWHK